MTIVWCAAAGDSDKRAVPRARHILGHQQQSHHQRAQQLARAFSLDMVSQTQSKNSLCRIWVSIKDGQEDEC